jgi:hypothetical protein
MAKTTKAHQRYKLTDGTIVPGVTTVIGSQLGWNKNVLIAWARREALAGNDPTKVRDKAADIGTLTHYMVECHIKGTDPDLSEYSAANIDKAENGFLAFLDWEKDVKPTYLNSELGVVSEKYRYGGTVDQIVKKNGDLWLLDLKTSKGIYVDMKIQVAAYKMAYEEQTGRILSEVHILKLGKEDGSFEHHKLSQKDIDYGWAVFQHCRRLYDIQKHWN